MGRGLVGQVNGQKGGGLMEFKTNWAATDAITDSDLKRIEENILRIREEVTLPLRVEVLTGFPSHAVGRLFYHSGDKRMYVSTGTEWV
jgi:succinylglutamate desuccinylase